MNLEKIMSVDVRITNCSSVCFEDKSVCMLGFEGSAQSEYFEGEILPFACDTQKYSDSSKSLSARYMLKGRDLTGNECSIFIENNAQLSSGELVTTPSFLTDSPLLSGFASSELEGRLKDTEQGVEVEIYERVGGFDSEEIHLRDESRDIYCELLRPEGVGDKKQPIVIFSHGYNSCSEHMRHEIISVAKRGIASIGFDYCGGGTCSKSSGKTYEMTIDSEQNDLLTVIDYVYNLPWVDKEQIYIYGGSQGGFLAGITAPEVKEKIKGLFLIFPAFCIPDHWNFRKGNCEKRFELMGMTISSEFVDSVPLYDVYEKASQFEGEVHIFHGDADSLVDLSYSQKLVQCYKNASLYIFPNQGHGFDSRFTNALCAKVVSVIKKNAKK